MNTDLTKGPVFRTLIKFCWPLVLANLLQTLYNLADMVMAGHYIGKEAMSAISAGGQLAFFLTALSTGLAAGGQILLSQQKGASYGEAIRETAGTLLIFSAIAGVLLSALGYIITQPMLNILSTPPEALGQALEYMKLTSFGIVFVFLYNSLSALFRGLGDSKRPLYFVLAASITNVLLNYIFLTVIPMGIRGIALATVISQALSFALALISLYKNRKAIGLGAKIMKLRMRLKQLWGIIKIGIPFGAQMAVINLANMYITSGINRYGVAASAALGAGVRITNVLLVPMMAVGNGATTMVGQSMGAGQPERAGKGVKCALVITLGISLFTMALCQLMPDTLIGLFHNDTDVLKIGASYLTTVSWCFIGHSCHSAYNAAALGVGFSAYSLFSSSSEALLGRVFLTWLLGSFWGLGGIFISQAASPYISALIAAIYYYSGRWKKRKIE